MQIFDSTIYTGKPTPAPFPIMCTFGYWLTNTPAQAGDGSQLSQEGIEYFAQWAVAYKKAQLVCIDLEGPLMTPANCLQIIDWMKIYDTGAPLAFFNLPLGDPAWQPVYNASDYITVCQYIFNQPMADQTAANVKQIAAARLQSGTKQIISVTSPRFQQGAGWGWPDYLWNQMLPMPAFTELVNGIVSAKPDAISIWDSVADPWSAAEATWVPVMQGVQNGK